MVEQKWGRALLGAVIGLVLGVFLGEHRAAEIAAEEGQPPLTGLNPVNYMHSPRFWFVLVVCTIVFAFILGRLGRPASQSDL
jgi:hypothetical protein